MRPVGVLVGLALALRSGAALGQTELDGPAPVAGAARSSTAAGDAETVFVVARPSALPRIAGSAHILDREDLEKLEATDIHNVLQRVPGVYVRPEDGYGLRPNIGLRGANPDRSSKVTLLEDGILLGPAPYSAPAAYYFPMLMRIVGVEVFKGPAAILQGPQTIGGAVNLQTRPVPEAFEGEIDLALGVDRLGKVHGVAGYGDERWGVLVEGAHLETDGFRELDGGGNTGFTRTDLAVKARVGTDPNDPVHHRLELKGAFGTEVSNETYLGLTLDDFRAAPLRRYVGSSEDEMRWERFQGQVAYVLGSDDVDVRVTAYRHDLERTWRRFNDLGPNAPPVAQVLANPTDPRNAPFYALLVGRESSAPGDPSQALVITNNGRTFVSQGVDVSADVRLPRLLDAVGQRLRVGVRFHNDSIVRDHVEDSLLVTNGTLVPDGAEGRPAADNRGEAWALAAFLQDEITWGPLTLTPGLRLERIETRFRDRLEARSIRDDQLVLLPGVGAHVAVLPWLGVFGGFNVGFSAVSPGQGPEVDPERALNYEAGLRVREQETRLEVVGFLSDYENILGECTGSSGGCTGGGELNEQFNGGAALIYGLEATARQGVLLPWSLRVDLDLSYTLTRTRFESSFISGFGQWGAVEEGDELPYVPEHTLGGVLALSHPRFELNVGLRYVSSMRDVAGQGSEGIRTDAYAVIDALGAFRIVPEGSVYARVENLLDEAYVVSFRPFGARPGPPLQAQIGYRHRFE